MDIRMKIENLPDQTFGAGLATVGGVGLTVQALTEWASVIATWGNLLLVLAGIYFMVIRVKKHLRDKSEQKRRKTD